MLSPVERENNGTVNSTICCLNCCAFVNLCVSVYLFVLSTCYLLMHAVTFYCTLRLLMANSGSHNTVCASMFTCVSKAVHVPD